jgi:hypothetical protein
MQLAQCLLGPAAVVLKQGGEGDMPSLTLPKTARGDTAMAAPACTPGRPSQHLVSKRTPLRNVVSEALATTRLPPGAECDHTRTSEASHATPCPAAGREPGAWMVGGSRSTRRTRLGHSSSAGRIEPDNTAGGCAARMSPFNYREHKRRQST